jgi:hypothetical protein
LRNPPDPAASTSGHLALGRVERPGQNRDERRLPSAVGADQSDRLTGVDFEARRGQRDDTPVAAGDAAGAQQGLAQRPPPLARW